MSLTANASARRAGCPKEIKSLDETDPLRFFRRRFHLPKNIVYLDGNSLGALPHATAARLTQVVQREWGEDLIRSWNAHDWIGAPARVGDKIAQLIGAGPGEVIVADSTSVNLFKLLAAAVKARPGRNVILSERGNFPTDLYIAQGLENLFPNLEIRAVGDTEIAQHLDDQVAAVILTHVNYKSGRKHDMAAITSAAHHCGALAVWDLSHSAGAIALDLGKAGVDLAVGCGYKYLNAGPGAPGFLFVARRLQGQLLSPITGWFGHRAPFDFVDEFAPASDINRFLSGTPAILGLLALEVGVNLMLEAPRAALFAKSRKLCSLFVELVDDFREEFDLELVSPRDPDMRGSQISFRHPNGYAIIQALISRGVIADFRAPDVMRFGFAPLYMTYQDAWRAAEAMHAVMSSREWQAQTFSNRAMVT